MNTIDTIAAVCTGVGGAIGVIRLSGPEALAVLNRVWRSKRPLERRDARKMRLGSIGDEPVLAVHMPAPHSYTGDDVAELHCHGGAAAARRALERVLEAGARMAEPGEFTFRAFVNGKMDLAQAEAVADLVQAPGEGALALAERQLAGVLSQAVAQVREPLVTLLAELESRLDFCDQELDWMAPEQLRAAFAASRKELERLRASRREGTILREGVRIVIAGRPNAGKSSLLNRLLGMDRAIVSRIAGTTRDTLEESAVLRGIPVRLTDTAGLREGADELEQQGVARSRAKLSEAQVVFWVLDLTADRAEELAALRENPASGSVIAVWNKCDLAEADQADLPDLGIPAVMISAATGANLDALLDALEEAVWHAPHGETPALAVNARHDALLAQAETALERAAQEVAGEDWELAAAGVREALLALGRITGEGAEPDVLETIFSRFCIGK